MITEGLRMIHTQIKIFWDVMLFDQWVNYETTKRLVPEDHYDKEITT